MDPDAVHQARDFYDPEFEKEAWLSMVMLEWGSCGQVALVDDKPAGCALYAPPSMVPRSDLFPTAPVSADAILLTTMRLEPIGDEHGLGATLVQAAIGDLVRRGVRALEAFGIRADAEATPTSTPSATAARECSPQECMISSDFLEDVGFEVVAPHHRFPRLRLELDRDHLWKADVEAALDRLLETATLSLLDIGEKSALAVG